MEQQDYNTKFYNEVFWDMDKKLKDLRKKYRIKVPLTKEDAEQIGRGVKEGDLWDRNPIIPDTPKDAFTLFKDFYAQQSCIILYSHFIKQYKVVNEASIIAELKELDKWKEEAHKESYTEACKQKGHLPDNPKYEYLRLVNGFYDGYCMTWVELRDSSTPAYVYAKYVLLYEKLKHTLSEMQSKNLESEEPGIPTIEALINSNANISNTILDAYHSITQQPKPEEKLLESYIGQRHRYNKPYRWKVYGAFVLSDYWEWLEFKRNNKIPPYDTIPTEKVENALMDYAKGFKKGYYDFEKELLGGLNISNVTTNSNIAKIVFDHIWGASFFNKHAGWPESYGNGKDIFDAWYDTGIAAGKYYRAWYVIIQYYFVFEPMLETLKKADETVIIPENKDNGTGFMLNTINEYFDDLQQEGIIRQKDIVTVKDLFYAYFIGNPLPLVSEIFVKNNTKKKLAANCGKLYQALKNEPLSYEYLLLLKSTFSIFSKENIDEKPLNRLNLYKYCTSKT